MPPSTTTSTPAASSTPGTFRPDYRSLWSLLVVQAHNVFNDKISQFMLIGLAGVLAATATVGTLEHTGFIQYELLVSLLMALPFVLFAPVAGWVADRHSKRNVLFACLVIQAIALLWIFVCLRNENLWWATGGFFLLAVQSALLSPAKLGVLKELVGGPKLAAATGWMQMLVVLSIIIGTAIGGAWFKRLTTAQGQWNAAATIVLFLLAASALQAVLLFFVRRTPAQSRQPFGPTLPLRHFRHLGELLAIRDLRLAALGVAFFWFAGGTVALALIEAGKEVYPDDTTGAAIALSTKLNAIVGGGIAAGSLFVSVVSRRRVEIGIVPIGALGMASSLLLAALTPPQSWPYFIGNFFMGFSGGVFFVPLMAFIQDRAEAAHRGRVISAVNLMNALAGMVAVAFIFGLRHLNLSTSWQFGILAIAAVCVAGYVTKLLPRHFLRFIATNLVSSIYKVRALHPDRVPETGGALMISNHVSYVDAFIIGVASPRPVRFVIVDHFLKVKSFAWFLRIFDVIPISPTRAKDAIRTTAEAVKNGDLVCIFPEGQLTRTGMLNELKKGFELIVRQAKAPIVPVYMDALWGSIFSFERFRYFYKVPKRFPYPVTVHFGEPIPPEEVSVDRARQVIQDLSVEAFADRDDLDTTVAFAAMASLKRGPRKILFAEIGKARRKMSRRECLAHADALASIWRKHWNPKTRRVGILLPPGNLTALLHLATVLAGRIPVSLPTTALAKREDLDAWRREHEIDVIISSKPLVGDTPFPDDWLDLREILAKIPLHAKIIHLILSKWEPRWMTRLRLDLKDQARDELAAAYVTDEGQFVPLSHLNILASVHQIESSLLILPYDRIFSEAEFNSTGPYFFTLWHPLIQRSGVTFRNPSAWRQPAPDLLATEQPDLVLLTPHIVEELTSEPVILPQSIRVFLDFTGAPLEPSALSALQARNAEYCVALAPPALGAVLCLNTREPNSMIPAHLPQTGNKPGTVGRLMPGLGALLVPHNGDDTPTRPGKLTEPGELYVRGVSLPANLPQKPLNGSHWVATGLRGQFDHDGFLTLLNTSGAGSTQKKPAGEDQSSPDGLSL